MDQAHSHDGAISKTGADSLVATLVGGGIDVCFANPGTSEMHFVAALDRSDGMRCVLALFEGVATGAADGYYRMARKPAATLLHLGPGFANGSANLHNARKGGSGIVNVVGEHATFHLAYNAPLTADIEGFARPVSHWIRTTRSVEELGSDGATAVTEARRGAGKISTLIVPADIAWAPSSGKAAAVHPPAANKSAAPEAIAEAARALKEGATSLLLIGGGAMTARGKQIAAAIAAKTGCKLRSPISSARSERGAGRFEVPSVPYAGEQAIEALKEIERVVLCGTHQPVSNFAFPDRSNVLTGPDCRFFNLASVDDDLIGTLETLADAVGAHIHDVEPQATTKPDRPTGALSPEGIARAITALLPEGAIVVNEAVTTGRGFASITCAAAPHDWLQNTGGAIGFGMPAAIGTALACPDRQVLCLSGDGSAMYTTQSLWTMARENLDITTIIMSNRAYQILRAQLPRVGIANPGRRSIDMLTLDRPQIDWVAMAKAHGVEAGKATDLDGLVRQLNRGFAAHGPYLIELIL
ncbi:MAG: acetolactate synthase large subunit [Proteobacteria bacterium]|nr:acetolactate synthase large subunit [Pseudomonadota bacterium]